jgi:hypothetical protein
LTECERQRPVELKCGEPAVTKFNIATLRAAVTMA